MRRLLCLAVPILAVFTATDAAANYYCTTQASYTYVETEWWDGTKSGQWEFDGWKTVCYGDGGSSSSEPRGPVDSGGTDGGSGTEPPPQVVELQQQYKDAGCTVPAAAAFITEDQYNQSPAANFTFDQLSGGNTYAIITAELKFGLDQMVNMLDGRVPVVKEGYRTPVQNSGTTGSASCSAHTRGVAADISIRDLDGELSCTMWNMYVEAADGWIEPWQEMLDRGGTPHFHVDFSRPKNDPGTCSGYP